MKTAKTLEDYQREEKEKQLKMKRRNVYKNLMVLKATAKGITVSDAEIDEYLKTHSS